MKYRSISEAISALEKAKQIRFSQLLKVCEQFFGNCRVNGSHHYFKTPWEGNPRINLQKLKDNNAKAYQVPQVLKALCKLKKLEKDKKNGQ